MGEREVTAFLSWLALERRVSAATQNQALAALLFLYRNVLQCDLAWLDGLVRAKPPGRLPVVLSRTEAAALLAQLDRPLWLVTSLLSASCHTLRHSSPRTCSRPGTISARSRSFSGTVM